MNAGINEILIISTPDDTPRFEKLFGNGNELGLKLSFRVIELHYSKTFGVVHIISENGCTVTAFGVLDCFSKTFFKSVSGKYIGWISKQQLIKLYEPMQNNQYGQYLKAIVEGKFIGPVTQ